MFQVENFRTVNWCKRLNRGAQILRGILLIAGLNFLAARHFTRFDLSRNHIYSLSPETVAEIKLETVVTAAAVGGAIAALHRAHPYDTPAFDVFRHYDLENRLGLGRIGPLAHPAKLQEVLARLKKATGARTAGIVGKHNRQLKPAGVCAGSCGDLLSEVVTQGADLYVTGELTHHRALEAREAGLTCICLSHTVSERFALKHIALQLKSLLPVITLRQSRKDADPLEWRPL